MLRRLPWAVALASFVLGCSDAPGDDPFAEWQGPLKSACEPSDVVLGIDIASYQHPNGATIDWSSVAASRRFVIVKASESTGYTNPYYTDDATSARASGMIAGAYHYLRYSTSGSAQAAHFLDAVGGNIPDGDLPPMLDVEDTKDSATAAQRVQIMKDWLDTVEQATGRKPMIYSGAWYWGPYLGSPTGFSEHPLVWAAYTSSCPQIPDDFPGLTIWQYLGGGGTTPGIGAACDQDEFYGTDAELVALTNSKIEYAGESLGVGGQSYPIVAAGAVTVELGQTVTGWVKLKNIGAEVWKPNVVFLAPIPRDQPSPFQAASWSNDHRISTPSADVAPGEVGQFELDIRGSVVGESILELGWVAEGITWFADTPKGGGPKDGYFAVKVNVVPASAVPAAGPDAGPDAGTGTGGAGQSSKVLADDDGGCNCASVGGAPPSGFAWLAALGLFGMLGERRRLRVRARR